MAAVRAQVVVNGRVVGIAGLEGAGYLNITILASRTPIDPDPLHPTNFPVHEELELAVGGHDMDLGKDMHWATLGLVAGDEVTKARAACALRRSVRAPREIRYAVSRFRSGEALHS